MGLPSIKTLQKIKDVTLEDAKSIRAAMTLVSYSHQEPHEGMDLIDFILGTCGVEYISHREDSYDNSCGIDYCNTGASYAPTVMYCHKRQSFLVSSWGDIVECNPGKYS